MGFIRRALSASLLLTTLPAYGSQTSGGTVHNILVMSNGLVLFQLTGTRTTPPSCGTGNPTRWVFNANTAAGQAKMSLLMTAYATQKQIMIIGTSSCPDYGDTESIDYFSTAD
jgi:hypothetical protein